MNRKLGHNPASASVMQPASVIKRKRGAQSGNRNAFKHGFYSSQFKLAERIGLSRFQFTDLTEEIGLLRVELRRYFEAETVEPGQIDYETRLQALRTVSLAAESLTRLIRTQVILNASPLELENNQKGTPPMNDIVD